MKTFSRLAVVALVATVAAGVPALSADAVSAKVVPAPTTTKLFPAKGPLAAGTRVIVKGTDFTKVTKVWFGSNAGTNVVVDSKSQLKVTAPMGARGAVPVRVSAVGGTTHSAPAAKYTYVAPPSIALTPDVGPTSGGTSLRVYGTSLADYAVTMDGKPVGPIFVDLGSPSSPAQPGFSFATAPHAEGRVPVEVTTPGGTARAYFTYANPPNVTLSPSSGPAGTVVHLLNPPYVVNRILFDGVLANPQVYPDGHVDTIAPPHAPGTVNVEITSRGGTQNLPFTYTP